MLSEELKHVSVKHNYHYIDHLSDHLLCLSHSESVKSAPVRVNTVNLTQGFLECDLPIHFAKFTHAFNFNSMCLYMQSYCET